MAGHSHWANIKHKKGANDAKKAKVITQMGKLILVAVQLGGPDTDTNPRLRLAISKARSQNMNMEAIKRAIAKGAGISATGKVMEDLIYEGYGANGVAVVAESLTDNRNRTAGEIRKIFERGGGSLGAKGCVGWQFHLKSVFLVADSTEDSIMEVLLEADADAEDIIEMHGNVSIQADFDQFDTITDALQAAKLTIIQSNITKVPDNDVEINELTVAQRIQKLIDTLEDHDDITEVYTNFTPTAEIAAEL